MVLMEFSSLSETGLTLHDNYHEFCRLLGRFKVNFQVLRFLFFLIHAQYQQYVFSIYL